MEHGTTGFILTLISLIHGSFATIVSFIVFLVLLHHQYTNRMKRDEHINLFLFTIIYSYLFIYILTLLSFNVQTILGDLYDINFTSSWCTFRGYLISVMCSDIYQIFGIQAFFRLCRIIYPRRRMFRSFWFYFVLVFVQLAKTFVILCPILVWQDIDYLSNEHYCYVTFDKPRGMIYVIFTTYGIPLSILFSHYVRITIFLHRLPNNQTMIIRSQQKRDLIAIRRIFIHVTLLLTLVVPGTILTLIRFITGQDYPLTFRILWLGSEVSIAILTIEMILATPQLKNLFLKPWRQNRVSMIAQTVQRGNATTMHLSA
ncbi:unnamed protein product [Adineta ricciae]|uniref:G-protein coupled receptors family 1 profile domain-containing protein n=1 Tax=Adineta ricciae TaxID=249248 RepID=A0A813TDA4_ADIRI|nr:unnamed protein product [Adineta ricciae]CAF1379948.1 unnamed protein product [Adineta ricciae]